MSTKLMPTTLMAVLLGGTALADTPSVAVDIAPVHSLVARVMEGVGTPDLILPPGASPHEYSLRPSEAAALENADVVFWMGEDLAPWLEGAIATLAANASVTTLLELEETSLLEFREDALFEAHDHGDHDEHGHDDHDEHAEDEHSHDDHDHDEHAEGEHAHDEHDDHAKDDHAHDDHDHDEHAEGEHAHDDHDEHAHGAHDPHAWLSPDNAAAWLNVIAAQLSAADPDNAGAYFANAAAGREEIEALKSEISSILDPVRGKSFVAFHDAYQYFETDFDFFASGAISLGDATEPSPARIAEIQERVREQGIQCVMAEPQYNPGIVSVVLDGTEANTGVLDPLGSDLEPGPALYPQVLRNLASALAECL